MAGLGILGLVGRLGGGWRPGTEGPYRPKEWQPGGSLLFVSNIDDFAYKVVAVVPMNGSASNFLRFSYAGSRGPIYFKSCERCWFGHREPL